MKIKNDRDEHLEHLWYMKENNKDSIQDLKKDMNSNYKANILSQLIEEGLITTDSSGQKVYLTEEGGIIARKIIRSHRIAERLISDVLQEDFETGACEFEHTLNPALVDSICTLLGHPRECPHGKAIPDGECCRRLEKTAHTTVIPLPELRVGKTAQVAYVQCRNDEQLHRLESLQIRPGVDITLHQKYPTFVVECEGVNIALGEEVAINIRVWVKKKNT